VRVTGGSTTATAAPIGLVTVTAGRKSCRASIAGSNGAATGICWISEPAAGTYDMVASYEGSSDLSSSSSEVTPLKVAKATVRTTFRLSAGKIVYGHEQVEHLSVTVRPRFFGSTPTGTVTIWWSATALCVVTLSSAKGSCDLSQKKLEAGTYRLVATYGGSKNFKGSTSSEETLTVVKR
jgi:hypothetical protein